MLAPEPARITRIVLIGPYARQSWIEDSRTIFHSDYEFWVVVNHPLFTDLALWGPVETLIERETGHACAVTLAVGKQDFICDPPSDTYRYPAGETLTRRFFNFEHSMTLHGYATPACRTRCTIRANCTASAERRIMRWEHEEVIDATKPASTVGLTP